MDTPALRFRYRLSPAVANRTRSRGQSRSPHPVRSSATCAVSAACGAFVEWRCARCAATTGRFRPIETLLKLLEELTAERAKRSRPFMRGKRFAQAGQGPQTCHKMKDLSAPTARRLYQETVM